MSKKTTSKSTAIIDIKITDLTPHPDAVVYGKPHGAKAEAEDLAALSGDIADHGVLTALDVIPSGKGDGTWLVVDGCRRLEAAKALGLPALPCVDAGDVPDVGAYAVSKNAMHRRLSAGERLIRWADLRRAELAEAWKAGLEQAEGKGELGGKPPPQSRDRGVSSRSLAARFGCSDKDALAVMQIQGCYVYRLRPERDEDTGELKFIDVEKEAVAAAEAAEEAAKAAGGDKAKVADEAAKAHKAVHDAATHALDVAHDAVATDTSPRRWIAAYAGDYASKGGKGGDEPGNAPVDYAALAIRSLTGLGNAFTHFHKCQWGKTEKTGKKRFTRLLKEMLSALPDEGKKILIESVIPGWTPELKASVRKA